MDLIHGSKPEFPRNFRAALARSSSRCLRLMEDLRNA
jgi:hypothetical protein